MVVQVSRPCVDGVEGTADVPIHAIVAIEAVDEEAVDNPRETGALAEGAIKAKAAWAAHVGWGVEGGGLTVSKPHQEVDNHRFLLVQPGCKIPTARDKCVGLVDQVARGCFGEGPLLRRLPRCLLHRRRRLGKITVLWSQLIDDLMLYHKFLRRMLCRK